MKIGLDVGSTTLKCVVLDDDDRIIYKSYKRHFAQITESTVALLDELMKEIPGASGAGFCGAAARAVPAAGQADAALAGRPRTGCAAGALRRKNFRLPAGWQQKRGFAASRSVLDVRLCTA